MANQNSETHPSTFAPRDVQGIKKVLVIATESALCILLGESVK